MINVGVRPHTLALLVWVGRGKAIIDVMMALSVVYKGKADAFFPVA